MLASDLKTGVVYKENSTPFLVLKYSHIKMARGGATVKVKVRNLLSGSVMEKGYKAPDKIEDANIFKKNSQYVFKDVHGFVFMDPESYEQFTISEDFIGDNSTFLREGENVMITYFEGTPIAVDLPISMVFEITYTEPGYKGNTVSNVYKDAILDNSAVVKVPSFIKIGDKIKVDTRTGEYISKA